MNKAELIAAMAEATQLPKAAAARAVDAFISVLGDALRQESEVALLGFGTFTVKDRPARKGRNPRTGEEMLIPATKAINFKAGKGLKDAVAGNLVSGEVD